MRVALISGWIKPGCHSGKFITHASECHIMSTKATPASAVDVESEVMTSIDDADGEERVVIADISVDEAWLSMPLRDAVSLPDCR